MKLCSLLAIELANRSHYSIALLQLDIDYFKKINDKFGHPEGDRVLQELGVILKEFARQTDLVARFGGEEFLILLPNINKKDALIVCERLHQLIAQIKLGDSHIRVSIGMTISCSKSTFKTLYDEVDEA